MPDIDTTSLGRRAFLRGGSLVLAAAGLDLTSAAGLLADDGPAKGGLPMVSRR